MLSEGILGPSESPGFAAFAVGRSVFFEAHVPEKTEFDLIFAYGENLEGLATV
jgi:hypothetical protein